MPGGFNTYLAHYRCKFQPEMKILRILTISLPTCLFSLLLYEQDGEKRVMATFRLEYGCLPQCVFCDKIT